MKKSLIAPGLLIIILLGTGLRLNNISSFKFYPDAYQSLIVAHSISNYQSVTGLLGEYGMPYPYYLMWTRPGYPLLINLFATFFGDPVTSAQYIALGAGIISIGISYFMVKKALSSNLAGLVGSFLTAVSFNHSVWGGFIYTETTGIVMMLLFLWRLFTDLDKESRWAGWPDILTGALLTYAIFTRYEYALLILPVAYLIWKKSPNPVIKLGNISTSLLFFSAIFLYQLFPIHQLIPTVISQLNRFLLITGAVLVSAAATLIAFRLMFQSVKLKIEKLITAGLILFIWCLAGLLAAQLIFPDIYLYRELTAVRNFFTDDLLLGVFTLTGLTIMLNNKNSKILAFFILGAVLVLFPSYYNVNPLMQRYWTHMLPFLLIPAAWGGKIILEKSFQLLNQSKIISRTQGAGILFIFAFLVVRQLINTHQGIKPWNNGDWFRVSYEEKAANIVSERVNPKNHLLISALPEPYFYFSGISTHSILENDQPPFINISDDLNSKPVYIVDDMGMTDIFPNFSKFLTIELGDSYQVDKFWVGEAYHYSIKTKPESHPVTVYLISLGELKQKINQSQSLPDRRVE